MKSFIFKHSILDLVMTQEVTPDHIGIVGGIAVLLIIVLGLVFVPAYCDDEQKVLIGLAIAFVSIMLIAFLLIFNVLIVIGVVLAIVYGCRIDICGWEVIKEDVGKVEKIMKRLVINEDEGAYQK